MSLAPETVPADDFNALIDALLVEKPRAAYEHSLDDLELKSTENGPRLLSLDRDARAEAVRILLERLPEEERRLKRDASEFSGNRFGKRWVSAHLPLHLAELALKGLLRSRLPLSDETLKALLGWLLGSSTLSLHNLPLAGIASAMENRAADGPLGDDLAANLEKASARLLRSSQHNAGWRKIGLRLAGLIPRDPEPRLIPGEAWSDVAIADLAAMEPDRRRAWSALLLACQEVGGKPSAKWLKGTKAKVDAIGFDDFKGRLLTWFPLVDRPRTQPRQSAWEPWADDVLEPLHIDMLKGLAWLAAKEADRDLTRAIAALALSSYRKVPGKGPRMVSLGNAAVAALGMTPGLEAVGQLAWLKVRVKFGTAQKEVEKALDAAAKREGLPRDEVEEMAVPTYGMEEVGRRRETLGDYVAEIVAGGRDASLRWSKAADGKALKSVPVAARKEHPDELKDLQAAVKDIGKMLTAQRERIDGLFLQKKSWPMEVWRGRYLDHPLIGVIARRLIWRFETEGPVVDGAWLDGRLVDVDDRPLDGLGDAATVSLWHPIDRSIEEVTAWRDWLDRHQVRQPFKQAHREVYVLTAAERDGTRTYSNRFASHVLRQHQYHALCAARGWRNRLRLMVDDTYPPTSKDLPEWGLRAEFWVEGVGDNYGNDTTESGSYLHLSTDQVRFYELGAPQREAHAGGGGYSTGWNDRLDAEPVPLDRVPPLALSEVLRDVDLFVGVASVGNDPTWADGGPNGRHVDYWNRYSFGDLTANGQTRKTVLERLVPRLKIASRCSFTDKFLVVRGDLRTYKIHLGSGNILMEPNDQYLCIVPRQSTIASGAGVVFLPFEGDGTLSIILSKALLLADDRGITDPTIISQIKR